MNTTQSISKDLFLDLKRFLIEFQCDPAIPSGFGQAMKSLAMAMEYNDIALMRSHMNTASEAFADVVDEAIQKRLGWPERARKFCANIWSRIAEIGPRENYDEVGKQIEVFFDKIVKDLADFRDPIKSLSSGGYAVTHAAELERDIQELLTLRDSMLHKWPWSNRKLPPVDRQMVAEARAGMLRGERGEGLESLISRSQATN